MADLPPTLENVFNPAYWEPVPPMPTYSSRTLIGKIIESYKRDKVPQSKIDKATKAEVEDLLCYAGAQLLAGESLTRIGVGEQLSGPDDNTYALPGAVVLIDSEHVSLPTKKGAGATVEIDKDRSSMVSEFDISSNAITAFMSGLTRTNFANPLDNYEILNPFHKYLNTNRGRYSRSIDLVAFCFNKLGEITNLAMTQWRNPPEGPEVILLTGPLLRANYSHYSAVGKTKNQAASTQIPIYERIREAHICLRGTLERARVPQKQQQSVLIPRLSWRPN